MSISSVSSVSTGDIIRYTSCGEHCYNNHILKVRIRDGKIIAVEPDDTVHRGIAREDEYVADEELDKMMHQGRPCAFEMLNQGCPCLKRCFEPRVFYFMISFSIIPGMTDDRYGLEYGDKVE